uniref:Uncharacterized protein n=1 Tax=Sander lucioperca TaxID=283035 RepID=A0A8C9Z0E0_SANLU
MFFTVCSGDRQLADSSLAPPRPAETCCQLEGHSGYNYTKNEYFLLCLHLASTLLRGFRAPKTETFGNTAAPVLV